MAVEIMTGYGAAYGRTAASSPQRSSATKDFGEIYTEQKAHVQGNLTEKAESAGREAASVSGILDTVVSHRTEYTDPMQGGKVAVEVKDITSYTEEGIVCREVVRDGEQERTRELWSLRFTHEDDFSRVQDFLGTFGEGQRLTFATQEAFWSDFLDGAVSEEDFRAYFAGTKDGVLDFEGAAAEGRPFRELLADPYAAYLNNNHFVARVWTEEELQGNGDDRVRTVREKAFRQIGVNAPDAVRQAWLDAADEVGIDGSGITAGFTLDHIPQMMIQRFLREYHGQQPDDLLGNSVQSARRAAEDALYMLDHPLEPDTQRSVETQRLREQERAFYQRFLELLSSR